MAQINYLPPVKSVSGKLGKGDKVIYYVRKAATSNLKMLENPYYSALAGKRSTPYSSTEIAAQTRFGNICRQTQIRLTDPTKKAEDLAAFKAQSVHKTLRQYVWHKVSESIN